MKYSKGIYARNKKNGIMINYNKGMEQFHDFRVSFDVVEVDENGEIVKVNDKPVAKKQQEPINITKEENEEDIIKELTAGRKKK